MLKAVSFSLCALALSACTNFISSEVSDMSGSLSIPNDGKHSSWSQSGTVNPKNAVSPARDGQTNVSMQVKLTPMGVYTVQFEVGSLDGLNNPVAIIQWTAHGNNVRRKVSAINGMSISAPCDAVSVKVSDEQTSSLHHRG